MNESNQISGGVNLRDGSLGLFKFYIHVLLLIMLDTSFYEKPKVFLYFNKPPTRCAGLHWHILVDLR